MLCKPFTKNFPSIIYCYKLSNQFISHYNHIIYHWYHKFHSIISIYVPFNFAQLSPRGDDLDHAKHGAGISSNMYGKEKALGEHIFPTITQVSPDYTLW